MTAATWSPSLPGKMLSRGMWPYVWRIDTPQGEIHYVGRTGDRSSPHATAPYTRMGQHLGFSIAANSLRRLLTENKIVPDECVHCELISDGPIYPEIGLKAGQCRDERMRLHKPARDKVAGLEKKLRDSLYDCGYRVRSTVRSKKDYDDDVWKEVLEAFSALLKKLKQTPNPSAVSQARHESSGNLRGESCG